MRLCGVDGAPGGDLREEVCCDCRLLLSFNRGGVAR